jgi:hypothetical protein
VPKSKALADCGGHGDKKLERYGDALLLLVRSDAGLTEQRTSNCGRQQHTFRACSRGAMRRGWTIGPPIQHVNRHYANRRDVD